MHKIIEKIDTNLLLDVYRSLEPSIIWTEYFHKGKQTSLQFKDDDDPWTSSVGKSKGHETNYEKINPFFKNTIFEELILKYNLRRTRLMWIEPFSCYTIHKDETPRLHIPLITNPDCYFLFKFGKLIHLETNYIHKIDTRLPHTFINCSNTDRLHLVGATTDF